MYQASFVFYLQQTKQKALSGPLVIEPLIIETFAAPFISVSSLPD